MRGLFDWRQGLRGALDCKLGVEPHIRLVAISNLDFYSDRAVRVGRCRWTYDLDYQLFGCPNWYPGLRHKSFCLRDRKLAKMKD